MAHCEFTPTIQIDCIKEIIALARQGTAGNGEIAKAIEHGSCFAGSAAALYLTTVTPDSEPDAPIFGSQPALAEDCSIDDICDELDNCCKALSMTSANPAVAVDWGQVVSVISLVWQLIQQWRNR